MRSSPATSARRPPRTTNRSGGRTSAYACFALCGARLLRSGLFVSLIPHPLEALTVELVEPDSVGLVGDQQIKDRADERQAAFLAGEAAPSPWSASSPRPAIARAD